MRLKKIIAKMQQIVDDHGNLEVRDGDDTIVDDTGFTVDEYSRQPPFKKYKKPFCRVLGGL
jgi:hypothetical protein